MSAPVLPSVVVVLPGGRLEHPCPPTADDLRRVVGGLSLLPELLAPEAAWSYRPPPLLGPPAPADPVPVPAPTRR